MINIVSHGFPSKTWWFSKEKPQTCGGLVRKNPQTSGVFVKKTNTSNFNYLHLPFTIYNYIYMNLSQM